MLLFARFPPEGSRRLDELDELDELDGEDGSTAPS